MSKMSVQCKEYRYDFEDVGGNIYVHKTATPPPGTRGVQSFQPSELIFSGSAEEANYISDALSTVTGRSKPLQPKEKIVTPAPESKGDAS